jgi:hypothetical protein
MTKGTGMNWKTVYDLEFADHHLPDIPALLESA